MNQLIIRERAVSMITEAYHWYEDRQAGLGEAFLKELELFYSKLITNPLAFHRIHKNFRQVALKRFPYVVVYEVFKKEIVVFAVFHTKRNPRLKFKR